MTYERFLQSCFDAFSVRSFLYFTVYLRELFSGTGFTCNAQGVQGALEYICPNRKITDLGDHRILDLNVVKPNRQTKGASMATTAKPTSHAPLIYTPNFFRPEKAYEEFTPDIPVAYREGVAYAAAHKLATAQRLMRQGISHAFMFTDLQKGFRDRSLELPVNGTDNVVLRVVARLINGIVTDYYTILVLSQDGHPFHHISFDTYWRDNQGHTLDLSARKAACMTLHERGKCVFRCYGFTPTGGKEDIGYYRAQFDQQDSVEYWDHLQATGQGDIWAFVPHCQIGMEGSNFHPFLAEAIAFAAGARSIQPMILGKGHIHCTDWFGPLVPCRPQPGHSQGGFRADIVDLCFKPAKTTDFSGVAEDFCHYYMQRQTMRYLEGTEFLERLRFLTDGTAPIIPNMPHVAALNDEARQKGVQFITHDTPFES